MKLVALAIAALAAPAAATAEPPIGQLCGPGHPNEIAAADDVQANADGFYLKSLGKQVRRNDPRLFVGVGDEVFLCTRPAATPAMERTKVILQRGKREVKYLFVPPAGAETRAGD